ncbi:MAG: hypothetical protein BWY26_00905 [Elusimicrobia bacterium ADurb.Bin231]|nr:MAG: hypothetical protein BWY26_00905 [Elusimicrobia bacterium ADurb.Bin231]
MDKKELENTLKEIITHHGFSSNTVTGFSCYISDRSDFPTSEGIFLWNCSKSYERIETQIQKYSAMARNHRMKTMLKLSHEQYKNKMLGFVNVGFVKEYLIELQKIGCFEKIGTGVNLFGEFQKTYNIAAKFSSILEDDSHAKSFLKNLEIVTIKNPIVKFCEDLGYFICKNKDNLVTDKYSL